MVFMFRVIYSERFLDYTVRSVHPERPQRLTAIVEALQAAPWADQLDWQEPTPITQRDPLPWLRRCHSPEYLAKTEPLQRLAGSVLLLAVNAWLDGVDYAVQSRGAAFALTRPGGHHAERDRGMGFCILANAAIAAHYALTGRVSSASPSSIGMCIMAMAPRILSPASGGLLFARCISFPAIREPVEQRKQGILRMF